MGNSKSKPSGMKKLEEEKEEENQEVKEEVKVENNEEKREENKTDKGKEVKRQPTQEESSDSSSDSEGENDLPETLIPDVVGKQQELQYAWEQKIVDDTLMKRSPIRKAAIFGLDGALRAWAPPDFTPEREPIQDILDGFNGDVTGLAERGLVMGCGANDAVPAKMEENVIFGNDGKGGGTSVFRTMDNLIIIVFRKNPTISHRLAMRTATFMRNYKR